MVEKSANFDQITAQTDATSDEGAARRADIEISARRPQFKNAMRFTYATGARPLEGFTIKRGIGSGGFGQVYYAVSDAGKEVALKHIQRNLDVELRGVGQCLNLKHPNLLALYDIRYDEAGEGWVVMEYVTGESLADVMERNPNGMPRDQIAVWLAGVAAGVGCLHDHGIVHRDLKPGNIFNDAGIIKVGDYGLSKFISTSRRSAQTESVGTFHYMAPEIGKGRYGKEIDVYALGVILYEMLTGDVPFDGESSQEIIMKHLTAEPELDPIPQPYRTAIERALRKDPEKRLGSVREMIELLDLRPVDVSSGGLSAKAVAGLSAGTSSSPGMRTPDADDIVEAELHQEDAPCEAAASVVQNEASVVQNEASVVQNEAGVVQNEADEYKLRPDESVVRGSDHGEDTLYIDDTPDSQQEMEFGPVEHRLQSHAAIARRTHGTRQRFAEPQSLLAEQKPLPDEPIARVFAKGWRGVANWFRNPNISSPLKALVLVAVLGCGIPLVLLNFEIVLVLMAFGVLYGIYYAVRAVVITAAKDSSDNLPGEEGEPRGRIRRWQQRARDDLVARPWPQRLSELIGSLLLSAAIAGVLSVVIMVLAGESMAGLYQVWGPQLVWVALSTIGGAWAVLVLSKLWEGKTGDHILRRIAMLAIGLALGVVAYGIDASLYVDVGFGAVHRTGDLWGSWHDGDQPSLVAHLAYFGGLFGILRWWLQADPLRRSRLSLWAIVLSGLWGFVIPFPQPWGMMLAIAISVAVQISAPWMSTGQRTRLRQQFRLQDAQA